MGKSIFAKKNELSADTIRSLGWTQTKNNMYVLWEGRDEFPAHCRNTKEITMHEAGGDMRQAVFMLDIVRDSLQNERTEFPGNNTPSLHRRLRGLEMALDGCPNMVVFGRLFRGVNNLFYDNQWRDIP